MSKVYGLNNILFPRRRDDFYCFFPPTVLRIAAFGRAESGCTKHNICTGMRAQATVQAADGVVFSCKCFIFGLVVGSRTKKRKALVMSHNTIISVSAGPVHLHYRLFSPAKTSSLLPSFSHITCPLLPLLPPAVRASLQTPRSSSRPSPHLLAPAALCLSSSAGAIFTMFVRPSPSHTARWICYPSLTLRSE